MLKSPTIQGSIRDGLNKDISHSSIHYKIALEGKDGVRRIYNWDSVIDKYRDILLQNMIPVTLTDKEMVTYRFNPRGYCYDFYTSPDLWSIILRLNNMTTSYDFNRNTFLTFAPRFMEILNEIMMIEDEFMVQNKVDIKTK